MKKSFGTLVFLLCLILPLPVLAASARSLTAEGNEFYSHGKYDEALKAYEEAAVEQPESARLYFNKGNVYFKKGDYEKAKEVYEAAALKAKDLTLEAAAQYNLGNTAFFDGKQYLDSDLKKALTQYESSIRHYQEALRINPKLKEAARNIEVVRLMIKNLLDQIEKQEEKSKQEQKEQKEQSNQLREITKEQTPKAEQPEAGDSKARDSCNKEQQQKQETASAQKEGQGQKSQPEEKGEEELFQAAAQDENAKDILQEERVNRLERQRAVKGGYQPVDKDW